MLVCHCVRLEAYDRNFNFNRDQSIDQTDYNITLPEASVYKDINATAEVFILLYHI